MEDLEFIVKPRPIKWSKEPVLALIKQWKKWDLLYDKNNNLYYNKLVRANVLELISKNLQRYIPEMTSNEVRVKIHSLRTQFGVELGKINSSERDGVKYEPNNYWFDEMLFLKNFVNARATKKSKRKELKVAHTETIDENTLSDSDELLVPLCQEQSMADSSMSENYDPLLTSKLERMSDVSLPSETDEPTSARTVNAENISRENDSEELEENNNDDVLTLSKNITLKLSLDENPTTPEQEYENSITNFFRTNLREIKDKDLQDELALKIMTIVFEYKKKQRELDK